MEKAREKNEVSFLVRILPGVLLCFVVMLIGIYGAELIGNLMIWMGLLSEGSQTPVSGIFVAIIIGIIIRNSVSLSDVFTKGISFSVKYMLRAGIILLGLRLSLMEALKLGAFGIPLIVACISAGLFLTLYLTNKMKQSARLGTLIACGTGICGVTAIMATAPVIKAKENEISYAVANITIFGLTGMMLYPFLANFLFADDPIKAGLFLGTAIHDTAQVTGAALIYDQFFQTQAVVEIATVTKLTRNLFIIAIIPFVSYLFFKNTGRKGMENADGEVTLPKWYKFIPLFVIGFLLLSVVRTIGDATLENENLAFGLFGGDTWERIYSNLSSFGTTYLLGMAMAGVGLTTNFKMFKGIGIKPFYIGFTAAVAVGIVSVVLISLFGGFVRV
ncbi:putative integral membrane protein (TIGR00698 family) [Virgibacillus natechei]|uniref:Integral membrane protein (TIGR00698 family) n=1 Tax=Virgibacillus natechei TaxID=1216297 RepID=A0ABS4ILQ6_9BACI|nr:putative sulfate exporter family transporter [Virgibacillus natechei]MBP1971495.1 putative integral membrane protein (TIGR00698 family) [Virgibacillus natechei]UZD12547.1 putative sulfate exporter family transporter [Virgibacillus natechei]